MTISQTQIMWTCLPNGFVTQGTTTLLQLSIVVTPLFQSAGGETISGPAGSTLGPTVFENWPYFLRAVDAANKANGGWTVTLNGAQLTGGVMVDYLSANPAVSNPIASAFNIDAAQLWPAMFPSTRGGGAGTPVFSQAQATAAPQFRVHSYDAGKIALAIRAAHQHVVDSHRKHGKLVLTGKDPYSHLLAEHKKARAVHHKMAAALRGVPSGSTHQVLSGAYAAEHGDLGLGYELARHALFFDPNKQRAATAKQPMVAQGGGTPPNDFNSLIGLVGGQPKLLRKLGLIIDLTFPLPSFFSTLPASGATPQSMTLSVLSASSSVDIPAATTLNYSYSTSPSPQVDLSSVSYLTPFTYVDMTQSLFRTSVMTPVSPAAPAINNGFLPLGDETQYEVHTEDTEGTPFKIDTIGGGSGGTTDVTPVMPALRTAGFSISQSGRGDSLYSGREPLLGRQAGLVQYVITNNQPSLQPLYADDVVRGYAIDVAVGQTPGKFYSLCLRDSRFYFPGLSTPLSTPPSVVTAVLRGDEGYTKSTAGTSPSMGAFDAAGNRVPTMGLSNLGVPDLNLHTVLFGWDGWSLVAQRPGRAITSDVPPGDRVQTETPRQPLNTNPTNFPSSCQITTRAQAGSLPHLRFGNWYTFRARVIDLAGNDMSYGQTPNAVSQSAPKQYLRYEPVPNPVLVLQAALTEGEHVENLVIRSNPWGTGTSSTTTPYTNPADYAAFANGLQPMNTYNPTCARWVAAPKGSWAQAEAMGAFDANYFTPMAGTIQSDIALNNVVESDVPYTNQQFTAKRDALFALSLKEAGVFTDTQVWVTGDTTATGPSGQNDVTIITPPTAQNLPAPTNPGQPLAPGQYMILTGSPTIPYLPDANAAGILLAWGGTPLHPPSTGTRTYAGTWPEMGLVPLQLQWGTALGVTGLDSGGGTPLPSSTPIVFTVPAGMTVGVGYESTLVSTAKMASNSVGTTAPNGATIPAYASPRGFNLVHAVQQPMPPNGGAPLTAVAMSTRNPGDTSVTFTGSFNTDANTASSVDLITRWADYVDAEASGAVQTTDGTNRRYVLKSGRVQTWTLTPTLNNSPQTCTLSVPQQLGDTKTRQIFFQLTATSAFREYFPASLQSDPANFQNSVPAAFTDRELLDSATGIRIPSTMRPAPPKILYMVPTFGWSSAVDLGRTVNTRTGRGLRVFVDRPWFTTGDTEMLGVVVSESDTPSTASCYYSQWGQDPIRFPGPTPDALAIFDATQVLGFTGSPYTSVPLTESPTSLVTVLAFPPTAFDPTRNLWYFDIEFAPSAVEAPFVRLSLVRFQPNSIGPAFPNGTNDLRMSNVVLADMVKLAADRTATYFVNGDDSISVTISGHVHANSSWTATASGTLFTNTKVSQPSAGRVVYAQIQEGPVNVANPGDFDWTTIGPIYQLTPFQLAGSPGTTTSLSYMPTDATGTTVIPIPKPTTQSGTKHRLLITEHELFATDQESAFPAPNFGTNIPNIATAYPDYAPPPHVYNFPAASLNMLPSGQGTTSRIVFSDVLPLPW